MSKEFQRKIIELQDNMLNFAYQLTLNRDDAFDLRQETMLKALDNEDKFVNKDNIKGWLFTIMKNTFINNYRRKMNSPTVYDKTDDSHYVKYIQDCCANTTEGIYSLNEITEIIHTFSDDYRIPFTMHVTGYKYDEIAEHMKLPVGTIKSRIFIIRRRLQKILKDFK